MKLREKIDIFKTGVFEMFPDAVTELEYSNSFQLLIAIIMSAQTTDKQVNKVNKTFFKYLKTPEDGIKLGEAKIKDYIKTISFFNNKAKNIFATCQILVGSKKLDEYKTIGELIKLPGVGIKTAKVFLAVIDDAPFLAVDTHVHRVLNRVGIVKAKTPLETDKKAEKILNTDDLHKLHHSLIMFGRYHCTARSPKCEICPINYVCNYYKKKKK
ncbi:MAG: endonuclease III [Candidatus Gracilibacteria bacterium]|nr:endonuclease III [Candidatus Gracilibacteria bacterium]